jgi:hypothetical protein
MRIAIAVVAVVLAGCASEPCGPFEGTYETSFERLSGDCGRLPSSISTHYGREPSAGSCAGAVYRDGCRVVFDAVVCPVADGSREGTMELDGVLDQVAGPACAEGRWQITARRDDGSQICTGTYDVTMTRL